MQRKQGDKLNAIEKIKQKISVNYGSHRALRLGQIQRNQEIGRWLTLLASLDEVRTIVEIGTWSGRGSSQRLLEGARNRFQSSPPVQIWGFEANSEMYEISRRHLKNQAFILVWGSIIGLEDLEVGDLTPDEIVWLEHDKASLGRAPMVLDEVPNNIDMLVLDGGEFSSRAEFKTLRTRLSGWLVLDDIHVRKNRQVFEECLASDDFSLVHVSSERNGTAIFRVRKVD